MQNTFEKPHQQYQRERLYQHHLRRIDQIVRGKSKSNRNSSFSVPRSNKVECDRLQRKRISLQNYKIASRIEEIVKRQPNLRYIKKDSSPIRSSLSTRKIEQQKKICLQNFHLAQRLLQKHSDIESRRNKILKNINQYENIKRSMLRNRRVLAPSYSSKLGVSYSSKDSCFLASPSPSQL